MYNKIVKLLLSISILISVYLIHNILLYYFADYYNTSNYDTGGSYYNKEKKSENYLRKSGYTYFPAEHFTTNRDSIGYKYSQGDAPSSIFKSSDRLISQYSDEGYSFNSRSCYHYLNTIYTFDISETMKEYVFEFYGYGKILEEMEMVLRNDSYNPQYTTINGKKSLNFYMKNGTPTKRFITCSNKRMYFIETQSEDKLEYESNRYCSKFYFNSFRTSKDIIVYFLSLILLSLIVIGFSCFVCWKKPILNRYAFSLFVICMVSIIINFVIGAYQAYGLYTYLYANYLSVLELAGSLLTASCVSTPLCVYYFEKSKEKWTNSYIVPSFLKQTQYDIIKRNSKKGAYIKYICYPLMILSLLPLGICIVVLYSIPMLIICSITIWFNKWQNWVKRSKVS